VDLDTVRLKREYRRMAMLTHPDTRRRAGGPDFVQVRQALEELMRYLRAREASVATPDRAGLWFWRGKTPERVLRLGEYLFYTGRIPWGVLIKAVVEQKRSRPSFGQLARRAGLLTPETLASAIRRRSAGEKLGDTLVRLAILDRAKVDRLLAHQRLLQRPLGWHFVRMGCLPEKEIPATLARLWRHNDAALRRI